MIDSNWKKVRSWNVGTPDGSAEKYTLYKNSKTGDFRIQNDFGNVTIDMERMSGYEFIKRCASEIELEIGAHDDIDDDWAYSLGDDDSDCGAYTP